MRWKCPSRSNAETGRSFVWMACCLGYLTIFYSDPAQNGLIKKYHFVSRAHHLIAISAAALLLDT